jgi:uncharacterized membrane protein YbhN (UPF0104 family)
VPGAGAALTSETRRRAFSALRTAIALALVGWLLSRGRLDLALLERVVTDPTLGLGTVAVWALVHVLIPAARWRALVSLGGTALSPGRAAANQSVALFLNTATPGGLGGDVWKALLADPARQRWPLQLGLLGVERACGVAGVVGVGLLAGAAELWGAVGFAAAVVGLGVGFAAARVVLAHPRAAGFLERWLPSDVQTRLPASLGFALVLSLAHYAVLVAWMLFLAAWLAPTVQPIGLARASAVGLFVAALPITPGGIGVGHVALAGMYGALGYDRGADVYNLLIVPQLGLNLFGGLVWVFRDGARAPTARGP